MLSNLERFVTCQLRHLVRRFKDSRKNMNEEWRGPHNSIYRQRLDSEITGKRQKRGTSKFPMHT